MAVTCRNTVIVGVVVSFISLIVALQATRTHTVQVNIARIVTSLLMLFLSRQCVGSPTSTTARTSILQMLDLLTNPAAMSIASWKSLASISV
jgi:hypothetical protein